VEERARTLLYLLHRLVQSLPHFVLIGGVQTLEDLHVVTAKALVHVTPASQVVPQRHQVVSIVDFTSNTQLVLLDLLFATLVMTLQGVI
jgi:hypothetical protein